MAEKKNKYAEKSYAHDNVLTIYCTCTIVGLNQYLHGGKTQPNCQKYHITTSTSKQLRFFLIFTGQHLNTESNVTQPTYSTQWQNKDAKCRRFLILSILQLETGKK